MPSLLKRSRLYEPTKTSSKGLKVIELSSDSKSVTPTRFQEFLNNPTCKSQNWKPAYASLKKRRQPVKETAKDETGDSDVQILRVTSKPLSHKHVPKKASPAATLEPQQDQILRHQLHAVGGPLPHRPGPASPVPAAVPKTSPVNSPGRSTKFTLEVSLSQDKAPMRLREEFKSKKRKLFRELRKSVQPAIQQLAKVEEYFGQNGFSASFSTDDTTQLWKAASKKLRHIDRSQVALDWGPAATGTTPPALDGDSTIVHPVEQAREILSARFNEEHHDPPITFANDINNRHLSGKFQFVNEYIIHPGVKITDHRLDIGCSY
ncbi:hypothetical protein DV736_g5236, partial [Chaetothyriales sp. CBS 134916]